MADSGPPVRRPRVADHRTHWALVAVSAGLVVVVTLTGLFFLRSARLEEARSLAENEAIARGVAAFIEAKEQAYLDVLVSYAGRFRFREAIERRDRAEAVVHLRQLNEAFPELDRAFLADPAGVVWAVYPDVPGVVGRSSAHRDWYQGVSPEWEPYVSEVSRTSPSRGRAR
ncbi:MAG: hypothetical protein HYV62_06920 [Candidatus Rokubacteria bacterium]|nr:hypothetical protein [Candidatus Rokubacteria bacterium]